jgi:hypothetical protein
MSPTADTSDSATTNAPTEALAVEPVRAQSQSSADRFMRRLLRLPEGKTSTAAEARSAFQRSLGYTTCRCLLMYIILPFVLPAVGIAQGVGPWIAIPVGVVAMVSIVYSIRRFWRADHSKRWHYTVFGTVIIGSLVYLTIKDTIDLFA